ncbi:COP1-interactive protein 1-like [Lotus japonicus]|uniref:COP1-interactive protein 1-like n=1 Tax=Lotus japonicus TaxID=34305 RepID=UPI00258D1525|nr:COP1-interactive protein 1-like [Lotus japonicus]
MNFANAELLKVRERKMARFSPKFSTNGDAQKKRGEKENKGEGAQAPKRRKLVKTSSVAANPAATRLEAADTSTPNSQAPIATATKSKNANAAATGSKPLAGETTSAVTKPTATGTSTSAATKSTAAGATTSAATKSTAAGATTAAAKLAAVNAATAAFRAASTTLASATASESAIIGVATSQQQQEWEKRKEKEVPKSPPRQNPDATRQVTPPGPPPTNAERTSTPSPRQEERPPIPKATITPAQIGQATGDKEASSSHSQMLRDAIEPSEFLLTGINREVIEKEVLSRGINETKEESLSCLLRVGCIFAHAFDSFSATAAATEELRAENAKLGEDGAAWKKSFEKILDHSGKEKIRTDKMIGAAGNKIGELEDHLKLMKEEVDGLDASLQACKKEKEQVEKDLVSKGEALAAKESDLKSLVAELKSAKKALAEQEKKVVEAQETARADLEAVKKASAEEVRKMAEAHGAALAAKELEMTPLLAKLKELESELAVEGC